MSCLRRVSSMLETVGMEAAHLSQAWPLNDTGRSALLGDASVWSPSSIPCHITVKYSVTLRGCSMGRQE